MSPRVKAKEQEKKKVCNTTSSWCRGPASLFFRHDELCFSPESRTGQIRWDAHVDTIARHCYEHMTKHVNHIQAPIHQSEHGKWTELKEKILGKKGKEEKTEKKQKRKKDCSVLGAACLRFLQN